MKIFTMEAHLAPKFAYLPPRRASERKRDFSLAFKRLCEAALEERADAVILPGDTFDNHSPDWATMSEAVAALKALREAEIPVFAVLGNHDAKRREDSSSPMRVLHEAGLVRVFPSPSSLVGAVIDTDLGKTYVGGISYDVNSLGVLDDPLTVVRLDPPNADFAVFVMHYATTGTVPPMSRDFVVSLSSLPRWANVTVSGHIHDWIERRLEWGATLVYAGTGERLSFSEENQPKGYTVIHAAGAEDVEVERVELPTRPMVTVKVEGLLDADRILSELDGAAAALGAEAARAIVRLLISGKVRVSDLSKYDRARILEAGRRFFGFKLDERFTVVGSFETRGLRLKSPRDAIDEALEAVEREYGAEVATRARELLDSLLERYSSPVAE